MSGGAHPSSEWDKLVNAAVLGADRAPRDASDERRQWAIALKNAPEPAVSFLNTAATLAVYKVAGGAGDSVTSELPTPLSSSEPVCSRDSGTHLQSILFDDHGEVLLEWCEAAVEAGLVAPPEFVPALLSRAATACDRRVGTALLGVTGARGRWFAGLNPEWSTVTAAEASANDLKVTWEEGERDERIAALKAIRRVAPETARELLQQVWNAEAAADRARFLTVMTDGLSKQDEPLLEPLLDDRSKQVRTVASQLLSLIPDSSFSDRMAQRVDAWLDRLRGGGLVRRRSARVEFTPPDELDAAAARDGLEMKAAGGLGPKAVLLRRLASRAPLSVWRASQGEPDDWLEAALNSDWTDALIRGWIEAAGLQNNAAWAETLLSRLLGGAISSDGWQRAEWTQLMNALPRESAERVALTATSNKGLAKRPRMVEAVLNACEFGWGQELSHSVAEAVSERLTTKEAVYDQSLRQVLRLSAVHIDPSAIEAAARLWTEIDDHWSDNLEGAVFDAVGTLRLRRDMLAALRKSSETTGFDARG